VFMFVFSLLVMWLSRLVVLFVMCWMFVVVLFVCRLGGSSMFISMLMFVLMRVLVILVYLVIFVELMLSISMVLIGILSRWLLSCSSCLIMIDVVIVLVRFY